MDFMDAMRTLGRAAMDDLLDYLEGLGFGASHGWGPPGRVSREEQVEAARSIIALVAHQSGRPAPAELPTELVDDYIRGIKRETAEAFWRVEVRDLVTDPKIRAQAIQFVESYGGGPVSFD